MHRSWTSVNLPTFVPGVNFLSGLGLGLGLREFEREVDAGVSERDGDGVLDTEVEGGVRCWVLIGCWSESDSGIDRARW